MASLPLLVRSRTVSVSGSDFRINFQTRDTNHKSQHDFSTSFLSLIFHLFWFMFLGSLKKYVRSNLSTSRPPLPSLLFNRKDFKFSVWTVCSRQSPLSFRMNILFERPLTWKKANRKHGIFLTVNRTNDASTHAID